MKKNAKNQVSTTKKIVFTAVFTAIAYAVSYFEFPIFPAAPFLKLDFSAVFILLVGFKFGVFYGVSACAVKELICFLTKSSTGGVGEIANFLIISAFILFPIILYGYKKGLKSVIFSLGVACVICVGTALLVNRFINFPFYMGDPLFVGGKVSISAFNSLWIYVLLFNLIKSVAVSVLTVVLYKRISWFIEKI